MDSRDPKMKFRCPCCGHPMYVPEDTTPVPGDMSICFNSGKPIMFNDDMSVRLMTQDDIDSLKPKEKESLDKAAEFIKKWRSKIENFGGERKNN